MKKRDGTQIRLGFNRNTWYLQDTKHEEVKKEEELYFKYLQEVVFDYTRLCCGHGVCYKGCTYVQGNNLMLCEKTTRRGYEVFKDLQGKVSILDLFGQEKHNYYVKRFAEFETLGGQFESITYEDWKKNRLEEDKKQEEDEHKSTS